MSNGTRDFIKRFALQNLNYYIGSLMDSNCRKTASTPQDIADCKAVRSSSIHVAEDPDGFFDNSVRIAFETSGKEGWFGNYGSRKLSILFGQDGSFVKAELQNKHSFLLPNGGNIGVGCTAGVIRDIPTGDAASLDAGGNPDGGSETSDVAQPQSDASSDVCEEDGLCMADISEVADDVPDVEDASTDSGLDLAGDVTDTDGMELPPDMSIDDASDAEDAIQDAAADLSEDATAADGTELPPDISVDDTVQDAGVDLADDVTAADGVQLPPDDASVDATIQDAAADVENDTSVICQYQWQCPDTSDASLPEDATMSVADAGASTPVYSQLCGGVGGALSMAAPVNSAIVACTNNTINALMSGGNSCVAECAFFDSIGITLSADPTDLDLLAPTFFDQNWNPKPEVVLTLKAPIMSDGITPAFPDAMGKSYKFTYNFAQSFASGINVWNAKDKDASGNPMVGKITLEYQWANIITKNPGALDITFEGPTISGKAQYHYPCSTLVDEQGAPNAIVQCTEVK